MKSYCCVVWEMLSKELAEAKEVELKAIVGVPASVFATTYRVLAEISNFCPVCGSGVRIILNQEVIQPKKVNVPVTPPAAESKKITCPNCQGKKEISTGINCMTCWGRGYLNKENKIDTSNAPMENTDKVIQRKKEGTNG